VQLRALERCSGDGRRARATGRVRARAPEIVPGCIAESYRWLTDAASTSVKDVTDVSLTASLRDR